MVTSSLSSPLPPPILDLVLTARRCARGGGASVMASAPNMTRAMCGGVITSSSMSSGAARSPTQMGEGPVIGDIPAKDTASASSPAASSSSVIHGFSPGDGGSPSRSSSSTSALLQNSS